MTYDIVQEGDLPTLVASVNKKSAEGWKLQGGVSSFVIPEPHSGSGYGGYYTIPIATWFMQAIVKED